MMISSKRQVIYILLVLIIPLSGFLVAYNFITMNIINKRIEQTNTNTVFLNQKILENDVKSIEEFMIDLSANSSDYRQLLYKSTQLNAYNASYNIMLRYRMILNAYPIIGGLYIYSNINQIYKAAYNGRFDLETKEAIDSYLEALKQGEPEYETRSWFLEKINDRYVLFRIVGLRNEYIICAIDMSSVEEVQNSNLNGGSIIYSSYDGQALTMQEMVSREGIVLEKQTESFYISGKDNQYFVVQSRTDFGFNIVYLMPYHGIISNMDLSQIMLLAGTFLTIVLITVIFGLLQKSYFKPLERLAEKMNSIKKGDFHEKMPNDYFIKELWEFSQSFNQMVEQITYLKIDSYEKELKYQRTQMQFMQLQIKSHFFLNCLKNLYGMAQEEKREKVQEYILALSTYFRYKFKDSFVKVPLAMEMDSVRNYINLQKLGNSFEIVCNTVLPTELMDFEIPPMTILTFVENSFKHGLKAGMPLVIKIEVKIREGEADHDEWMVAITVTDNGNGFSDESIRMLNDEKREYTEEHIGIENVRQRMSLIFQNRCIFSLYNNDTGACVEMLIPMDR